MDGSAARTGTTTTALELGADERRRLFGHVLELIERHAEGVRDLPGTPVADPYDIRRHLERYDFDGAMTPEAVLGDTAAMLRRWTVHTTHPGYFGLFNPNPAPLGVLGDLLTAAFNPQLAAWSHGPAAAEIDRHVVAYLGERLGLPGDPVAGHFTSGGAEANLTGVLLALTRTFPEVGEEGVGALPGRPVLYASAESHLAWLKIAHMCGLGRGAVRLVPVTPDLRMDPAALAEAIAADRARGLLPFLVVGTAGTTGAGVIDPLHDLADLAETEGMRFHVDAAWAGAAALSDRLRPVLDGIGRAHSVTLDAHKWLSMPMGAGTFLTPDAAGLRETFRVTTSFMPDEISGATDPYASSAQWSRRAIGLKLFVTLATVGRAGYAQVIERQTDLGAYLRGRLTGIGWRVLNDTPLPVVCFTNARDAQAHDAARLEAVARRVLDSGRAWISLTSLAGTPALRACITNFATTEADVDSLVGELARA
ncbi:pyridoxal phosphate-dependent decarboxylase family protein [Actinomadura harenae]|uniref:Pyridoxal-dependent decarboxylase n=1 Tax=Actinomadura harenae TaxID=2483351 RepID=A0A3M2LN73_9ACTN|nr:pyridoxal-dependent decarboxylase [Actinomadura harenae]RMI38310.1 pyridoxal-dependent decarboxylase [Actinomadura harenae]